MKREGGKRMQGRKGEIVNGRNREGRKEKRRIKKKKRKEGEREVKEGKERGRKKVEKYQNNHTKYAYSNIFIFPFPLY